MAAAIILVLAAAAVFLTAGEAKYVESVAANVDGAFPLHSDEKASEKFDKKARTSVSRKHEQFLPLVAFQCGFRNKYMDKNGEWRDDSSSAASCLQGKYDILKYCKRVYPGMEITNIVEYSHMSHISKWCKEDGTACKHQFTVRPYRCIVGEFVTESLQVPSHCRFSHVAGKSKCNDYKYWSLKAESECGLKTEEETHQSMKLHSFAILEPCGLSMFRGVEFVCCPKSVEEKFEQAVDLAKDADEDDYDEDEDDDSSEADDVDDEETENEKEADPYFKDQPTNAGMNEHERFSDAEERLEKKHRKKVTKVITQWSELFERYNKMKEKDPKGAEEYKREMTARFRKTVAALEEENKEQRTQIEEVHDERVQSALNEKKRQATHEYRAALAKRVGNASNKSNVLKTLKNYIKAEEKDRTHMLNRYRHLLRSDPETATSFEPILLHRLRYIDLRINGTLAMLHDFPQLEKQIRPMAIQFWNEYRRENTPEMASAEISSDSVLSGGEERNEKLIRFYKQTYERNHPSSASGTSDAVSLSDSKLAVDSVALAKPTSTTTKKATTTTVKTMKPMNAPLEEDSDEDQFDDDDEDEANDEKLEQLKPTFKSTQPQKKSSKFDKKVDKSMKDFRVIPLSAKDEKKVVIDKKKAEEEKAETLQLDDDEEDDDDEDDESVQQEKDKYENEEEDGEDEESSSSSSSSSSNEDDKRHNKKSGTLRERELNVAIEPIVAAPVRIHEEIEDVPPAYARHAMLVSYNNELKERSSTFSLFENHTNFAVGMIACACVVLLIAFFVKRRSNRHPGFIEVDVCTPEDRHVAGMQVNGYENPTYTYFDGNAPPKA